MLRDKMLGKLMALISGVLIAFSLIAPEPVDAATKRLNMSYVYFGKSSLYETYVENTNDSLQVISPSYFDLNRDGSLKLTAAVDPEFIEQMHEKGMKVVPFLSNHWDRELGRSALENAKSLADEIATAVRKYNIDGVNIDIENVTEVDRYQYTQFVKLLREKLPSHKTISVAVAANPMKTDNGWQGSYDYESLAKYSDYLIVMAYDESYESGPAGPVASSSFVEKSIEYALEKVPKEKIVLSIPFYGRYWKKGEAYGGNGLSLTKIADLIQKYNGQVIYDDTQSPKAVIEIESGDEETYVLGKALTPGTYTIYYENEVSIKNKLKLVQKYDLKGTASWSLGQETSDTWGYYELWLNGQYFVDAQGHWAQKDILDVAQRGWMVGVSNTSFSPDKSLTRAQAAVVLVKAFDLKKGRDDTEFIDVPKNYWAEEEINIAKEKGIIVGDEMGRFLPEEGITREEMAAMLDRTLEQLEDPTDKRSPFIDININNWSFDAVMKITQNEIFKGYPDGKFYPKEKITRAQMAALMNRISDKGYL